MLLLRVPRSSGDFAVMKCVSLLWWAVCVARLLAPTDSGVSSVIAACFLLAMLAEDFVSSDAFVFL